MKWTKDYSSSSVPFNPTGRAFPLASRLGWGSPGRREGFCPPLCVSLNNHCCLGCFQFPRTCFLSLDITFVIITHVDLLRHVYWWYLHIEVYGMNTPWFTHLSPVDGHLSCFSLIEFLFLCPRCTRTCEISDSWPHAYSALLGAAKLLSRKAGWISTQSTGHESRFSHTFSPTFNSVQLPYFKHSDRWGGERALKIAFIVSFFGHLCWRYENAAQGTKTRGGTRFKRAEAGGSPRFQLSRDLATRTAVPTIPSAVSVKQSNTV